MLLRPILYSRVKRAKAVKISGAMTNSHWSRTWRKEGAWKQAVSTGQARCSLCSKADLLGKLLVILGLRSRGLEARLRRSDRTLPQTIAQVSARGDGSLVGSHGLFNRASAGS